MELYSDSRNFSISINAMITITLNIKILGTTRRVRSLFDNTWELLRKLGWRLRNPTIDIFIVKLPRPVA
jgi:hypothetical protein